MKDRVGTALGSLILMAVALLAAPPAAAGQLSDATATPVGSFDGLAYVQYDGIFEGHTSTGAYRVPYQITAPADPVRANRTVLVEPPHPAAGLGARDGRLGQGFLFSRGFVHAGIGWSTTSFGNAFRLRILDPTVRGVFIDGGIKDKNGRTDDEIIVDFARALAVDANAQRMIGRVDRRYVTGFSDTSDPVLRLVTSGRASEVFDLALPFIADAQLHDPQAALGTGHFVGKLIIVNSEADASAAFVDRGGLPNQYRFHRVAGAPHVPDDLLEPNFSSHTTPASYAPALRAHFLHGHAWVRGAAPPPASTHLRRLADGTLDRDVNGNAIAVNAIGNLVPRLPFVELGEAHYISGFIGSFDNVKTIGNLGFASHDAYLRAFDEKLADYLKAGYILKDDADAMHRRAALCAPLTFTQTYRDRYDAFIPIIPCGG